MVPHDTYETPDGRLIRVLNNNILVKIDQPDEISRGGIIIPPGSYDNPYATGVVVAVGYHHGSARDENGKYIGPTKTKIQGLEVGDGVYCIRFLNQQDSNVLLQRDWGDGLLRLRPSDIIFVFDRNEDTARFQSGSIEVAPTAAGI